MTDIAPTTGAPYDGFPAGCVCSIRDDADWGEHFVPPPTGCPVHSSVDLVGACGVNIPTRLIEAAARHLWLMDANEADAWDSAGRQRQRYLDAAGELLAAVFAECEVVEDVGARLWRDGDEANAWNEWPGRMTAERWVASHAAHRAANPPDDAEHVTARRWMGNARLIRRLVITTPPWEDS